MTSHKVANLSAWRASVLDARRLVARAQKCRAYQFCDGFDNYNTASQLYEFIQGSPTISAAYRRFAPPSRLPGQGISIPANCFLRKNMQSNQATFIIKIAYNFPTLSVNSAGCPFLGALDNGTVQWSLVALPSGALAVYKGNLGVQQAISSPGTLSPGYQGIEIEITVGTSSGLANLWVNGTQVLSASAIDTQITANAYAGQVFFGDILNHANQTTQADDFRVWDNTGATQNAPLGSGLGDSRLYTKLAVGAGTYAQFTPNGASANWQCVNDNPPDGDTTYVSGSTTGLMDAYNMPTAGFDDAPVMVVARAMARIDSWSGRQIAVGVDSGGHNAVGPTVTLGSSYAFVDGCIAIDPNGSADWTAVSADGAQFFMEEIS